MEQRGVFRARPAMVYKQTGISDSPVMRNNADTNYFEN